MVRNPTLRDPRPCAIRPWLDAAIRPWRRRRRWRWRSDPDAGAGEPTLVASRCESRCEPMRADREPIDRDPTRDHRPARADRSRPDLQPPTRKPDLVTDRRITASTANTRAHLSESRRPRA